MGNKLPVISTVLYGEEEKVKNDRSQTVKTVPSLKDLVAPQTVPLFTINYELIPIRKRP